MSINVETLAAAKAYVDQAIHKAELDDIELDKSLSKSNYAADAKTVGDRLNKTVRFDSEQALTEEEKAQARANIGIVDGENQSDDELAKLKEEGGVGYADYEPDTSLMSGQFDIVDLGEVNGIPNVTGFIIPVSFTPGELEANSKLLIQWINSSDKGVDSKPAYLCPITFYEDMAMTGNLSFLGIGPNTGEPFICVFMMGENNEPCCIFATLEEGRIDLTVHTAKEIIHTINLKFLPEGAGGAEVPEEILELPSRVDALEEGIEFLGEIGGFGYVSKHFEDVISEQVYLGKEGDVYPGYYRVELGEAHLKGKTGYLYVDGAEVANCSYIKGTWNYNFYEDSDFEYAYSDSGTALQFSYKGENPPESVHAVFTVQWEEVEQINDVFMPESFAEMRKASGVVLAHGEYQPIQLNGDASVFYLGNPAISIGDILKVEIEGEPYYTQVTELGGGIVFGSYEEEGLPFAGGVMEVSGEKILLLAYSGVVDKLSIAIYNLSNPNIPIEFYIEGMTEEELFSEQPLPLEYPLNKLIPASMRFNKPFNLVVALEDKAILCSLRLTEVGESSGSLAYIFSGWGTSEAFPVFYEAVVSEPYDETTEPFIIFVKKTLTLN